MPRRLFEQLVVSAGRPRTVRAAAALPFSLVAHVIAVAGALSVPAIVSQAVPEPVATPAARPFWPRVVVLKPPVRPTEAVVRRSASQTQHPFRASSAPTTPAWADAMPILTRTDSVLDESCRTKEAACVSTKAALRARGTVFKTAILGPWTVRRGPAGRSGSRASSSSRQSSGT
jgi:hypothetical protein